MENCIEVLLKTKNRTTLSSSNSTPGYISEENENTNSKSTCTPMFKTALFIVAKIWKQPKCPSTDKWIKKMWSVYTYTHNGILLSPIKEWILPFSQTWVDLKGIMLSEVNQRKANTVCFHLCVEFEK